MQCMKFLRSNLQNPSQKFCKNLFDFEKPKKSQKLRLKNHEMHENERFRHLPNEEELD